eukprot:3744402-Amphidinium_carterae.1
MPRVSNGNNQSPQILSRWQAHWSQGEHILRPCSCVIHESGCVLTHWSDVVHLGAVELSAGTPSHSKAESQINTETPCTASAAPL